MTRLIAWLVRQLWTEEFNRQMEEHDARHLGYHRNSATPGQDAQVGPRPHRQAAGFPTADDWL
jgi:hypothetical protein